MPLSKRIVRPRRLVRITLDKEESFDLASVCHHSLVSTLKQLSNLAGHADQLFSELTDEFSATARRVNKLRERVDSLADTVSKLNAKAVQIPQGDLETYAKIATHYHGENTYKGKLFTGETQPECIRNLYNEADDSPVSLIRQCKTKRTDGLSGSQLFILTPFFKDGPYEQSEVDFEIKPVAAPPIGPKLTEKSEVKDQSASQSVDVTPDSNPCPDGGEPEGRTADSDQSPPADLVPIDVTGATFNRMCEYRESIRSSSREYVKDGTVKRKKRRQTVSGAPGMVFSEISTSLFNMSQVSSHVSLRTRSVSYERPKSAALESYAPRTGSKSELKKIKERERKKAKHDPDESNLARSCSLRRSLKSIFKDKRSKSTDLWAEGRPRSPGPPVIDLAYPMKRSRSLPRSLKSAARGATSASDFDRERSASTEGRLDGGTDERTAGEKAGRPPKAHHHHQQKAAKTRNRIPRSVSHSATLSGSTFVDHLARPKSMEVSPQPNSVSSPTTPSNDSLASSVTQDSHISIGKHIHINIPDKPWTKPFARVKLRFRRKQKRETKDDRQSSSGHWSASSSSARHSLDSDCRRSASSPDRLSLCDKDSAVSLNIHGSERCPGKISEETSTYGDGDSSTLNGSSSENDSIVDMKNNFSKGKAHDWLKTVTGKKGKDTSTSGKVKTTVSVDRKANSSRTMPESCLTTQNLKAHDSVHQPLNKGFSRVGDDESSIYSVDQEGFYTSMHKDCGLKKGIEDLLEEEEDNLSTSTISGNNTSTAISGHCSISRRFSSFISRKGMVKRKDSNKSKPPPPPRRSSMISDKTKITSKPPDEESPPKTELQKLADLAQRIAAQKEQQKKQSERSPSYESDAESIFARVQSKSVISPSVIPSLCSVTPIHTDEEDSDFVGLSKTWRRQSSQDAAGYRNYSESLKNVKSAPGTLDSSTLTESSFSSTSLDMSSVKGEASTLTEDSSGHYSTWPRSPTSKRDDDTRKSKLGVELLKPPECLTIRSPKPNLFYADEKFSFVDSRHPLPEAKTPDSVLEDRVFVSPTNNTFRAPNETSTPTSYKKGQLGVYNSPNVSSQSPTEKSLDSSHSSKKSAEWMSTWPRRKGVKFVSSAQPLSKDDSVLSTSSGMTPKTGIMKKNSFSSFPRKGDRAHFINIKSSQSNPPDSLPLSSQSPQQLQAAHAKLVISSPVSNRASFVENPYKRSVCSPVTANDLLKFWNYTSTDNWYNTLPRSSRQDVKPSFSISNAHDLQEIHHDRELEVKPAINKVPSNVNEADFPGPAVLDEDPASSKRPPSKPLFPSISAMKHALEFPGAPKKKAEPTNYGRTWYDGIDTLSTVVVMSPDGTQTLRGPQSTFGAFIKDQGTTLTIPGIVRHRRDSTTSSISTNSSSSGRKSVTFATIHKTSSSSLSRTSLDASSITSSQMSGDIPTDRRSVHSTPSDDGIQVTPQKRDILSVFQPRDPPVFLSTCLKRSSSNGSSELRANPPLETIVGSDSETPHNLSEDQSFDESTLCTCETSPKGPDTAASSAEPSVKRQKVNNVTVTKLSPKHRTGARSSKTNNIVVSTSFVGPSIKIDHPVAKVICENGNEIKPMPLITTSFVGAFKMDNGNEKNAECTLKHKGLFTNKTTDDKGDGSQETNTAERSVLSTEPYKTVPASHLSGQGCSKQLQDGDAKASVGPKSLSVSQPRSMCQISARSKQDPEDSAGSPSDIIAVRMNTSGSLPRQASAPNKLSSFSPEQLTTSTEPASSTDITKPVTSQLSTSSCVSSSSSPSSSSSSSPSVESSSVLLLPSSTSAVTTSSITTRTAPTTSSCSSSAVSRPRTLQTKPTTAKFVLPKLRPWNPPNLSNSRTSTLLSQLSAVATQGASLDVKPEAGDGRDKGVGDESGGQLAESPPEKDGLRTPGAATAPEANASAKDGHQKVRDKDDKQPESDASSSACNSPTIDSLKSSHLSRSSGSLNRWSTADIGSSALSLARSTSSLAGLGLSSTSLNRSCLSLAKSTESLASGSSTADRSRAAKLAFLGSGAEESGSSTKKSVDQRFAGRAGGQTRSRHSDKPQQAIAKSGESKAAVKATNVSSKDSSSTKAYTLRFGLKNSAPKSSPVQGKFVNSILGKLHKKGINTSLTRTSQKATAQK